MLDIAPAFANLGTETAFSVLARAKALEASGRRIVNLGIGQPDFAPPPHVVEAAARAMRDGHHGYTPATGVAPLREAVARYVARWHGASVDPTRVVVVPGGKVTMFFAFMLFGRPGVEIAYPDPGFPIYSSTVRFTGAAPVPYPLDPALAHAPRAQAILSRLTERTRLVVVNSPANPTGGVMPEGEVRALVAGLARWPKVAILADEIYSRMIYGGSHLSLLSFPEIADRVILLDGWSKTFAMTGWRLGFGVWPAELVPHVDRLAVNAHSCVNAVAQQAAIAALDGPQDAVDAMVAEFERRRGFIVGRLNQLPGWRCAMPDGAFYAFPDVRGTGLGEDALQARLLDEAGVATIAGTSFGAAGAGHLRVSYAASLADLEEAVTAIGRLPV
jgi:aspartate/methionine/tyrosine aminotransferase